MTSSNYLLTFFLVFEFKFNFTIKSIINPVNNQFCFKSKVNTTHMNYSFDCQHKHFLIEFDENKIMMHNFEE